MTWRPTSTYRLQLHAGFPLTAAQAITEYLDELGIGAVYVSPLLRATRGSTHGYDLVDPTSLNPELGTEQDLYAWSDDLKKRGLGRIVDFVPNHMGIGSGENPWWNDVLENGPSSVYANHFDIDWNPPKGALAGKVLLPILGAQYGEALESGELTLARDGATFIVRYFDHVLPVSPPSIAKLLNDAIAALSPDDASTGELSSIVVALGHLPSSVETAPERQRERAREKEIVKRRLAALLEASPAVGRAIDEALVHANGTPGDGRSYDTLDAFLQEQSYRLSDWRVATEEINYRRFFDINQLAAIRMEEPEVFDAMHALVLRWAGEGRIDGLRLDHTDGLYDPADYFDKLNQALSRARDGEPRPLYLLAEKILEPGEALPGGWLIDGTTGYDFLASLNGLWVDGHARDAMTAIYREHTGETARFGQVALDAKRVIMRSSLASEINMLAQSLERLAQGRRRSRDFTLRSLTSAIVETIAAFPVYRTYLRADASREPTDETHLARAIALAKRRNPDLSVTIFAFLEDMLLMRVRQAISESDWKAQVGFAMRFQQLTGPVMAKGVEDTAFYRYDRLLSLNEVGAQPDVFGVTIDEFHAANAERLAKIPRSMLATSTHDTKRGEDARARLSVLSEMPDTWRAHLAEWSAIARDHQAVVLDEPAPTANDQYYFFQAAIGALPLQEAEGTPDDFVRRMREHMAKATKEEKRETRWINPRVEYDAAVQRFVEGILADARFTRSLRALVDAIAPYGASNALAQVALKLGSPGVPDFYQGTELWTFSLCDPDNRGAVDYALRRRALEAVRGAPSPERARALLASFEDGHVKMHVCRAMLHLRRQHGELFVEGSYTPLSGGEHVVAFERAHGTHRVVVAAARLAWTMTQVSQVTQPRACWAVGDVWGAERLAVPRGSHVDALTGERVDSDGEVSLAKVFAELPVAVLVAEG